MAPTSSSQRHHRAAADGDDAVVAQSTASTPPPHQRRFSTGARIASVSPTVRNIRVVDDRDTKVRVSTTASLIGGAALPRVSISLGSRRRRSVADDIAVSETSTESGISPRLHCGNTLGGIPEGEEEHRLSIAAEEDLRWMLLQDDFLVSAEELLCSSGHHLVSASNATGEWIPAADAAPVALPDHVAHADPTPMESSVEVAAHAHTASSDAVVIVRDAREHAEQEIPGSCTAQRCDDGTSGKLQTIASCVSQAVVPNGSLSSPDHFAASLDQNLPPALLQYLQALHFQSVALSAEVQRVTSSHTALQSDLAAAQEEISKLRVVAHAAEAADEVPVHPMFLTTAGPPAADIHRSSDSAVDYDPDLDVAGPGTLAKSLYYVLSYPLQCCMARPNDPAARSMQRHNAVTELTPTQPEQPHSAQERAETSDARDVAAM